MNDAASDKNATRPHQPTPEKKVPWVELYFDLVIVFAIKNLAANIGHHPTAGAMALGLLMFLLLWWSWIGFTLLYNRWGDAARRFDVLALLFATGPMALIAIGFDSAYESEHFIIGLGLAGTRLLLAVLNYRAFAQVKNLWVHRISATYVVTTALFLGSAFVTSLWAFVALAVVALGLESGALLSRYQQIDGADTSRRGRARKVSPRAARLRSRGLADMERRGLNADALTLNPAHLAERFQLFLIIVLGEIIIVTATGASSHSEHPLTFAVILVSGLALAACLGWLYFERHAAHNEHMVSQASGAAEVARNLYAHGLLMPVFGLVLVSAGLEATTGEHAEPGSLLPLVLGVMFFMVGMVSFRAVRSARRRVFRAMSWGVVAGTAVLAVLDIKHLISPIGGIALVAGLTLIGTVVEGLVAQARERKA